MQVIDDPILLYAMLREWFTNLKPLYVTLNTLINSDKLSINDRKILINLMKEASKSCQKIVDFEDEIKYQFETLFNEVSALRQQRFELSVEVDDFEIQKRELSSKNKLLKDSVNDSSDHLKINIEKIKELNLEKAKLVEQIEWKKDEESRLERSIDDKQTLIKEMEASEHGTDLLEGTREQTKENIVITEDGDIASRNSFLSSRFEIIEIILSMFDNLIPNLKRVWDIIREIMECSNREVIYDKINSIGDIIADIYRFYGDNDIPNEQKRQGEAVLQEIESIGEQSEVSITSINKDIDQLSKKLAFLNLECEIREQKSNELLSKIELRNIALNKLEEYSEVIKNDIVVLENRYDDIVEKIKSLSLVDKNSELLETLVPFDEKFYFEEYQNKIISFYEHEKNRVRNLIDKSYEKLKNNERLLSLRQKELSIVDERTKKDFPNYELKLANLNLKLNNKDNEIWLLNDSIKKYVEKLNSMNVEYENHKKNQEHFANEKESLLQKIIDLERENKGFIEDINNLNKENHSLKEYHDVLQEENDNLKKDNEHIEESHDTLKESLQVSQTECDGYKLKINELENQISNLQQQVTETERQLQKQDETIKDTLSENENFADSLDSAVEQNVESDIVIADKKTDVSVNSFELDKLKTELSEQIQKRTDTEKALLKIEKINVSLTSQISKRDNLIMEYEEELRDLKERLNVSPETTL